MDGTGARNGNLENGTNLASRAVIFISIEDCGSVNRSVWPDGQGRYRTSLEALRPNIEKPMTRPVRRYLFGLLRLSDTRYSRLRKEWYHQWGISLGKPANEYVPSGESRASAGSEKRVLALKKYAATVRTERKSGAPTKPRDGGRERKRNDVRFRFRLRSAALLMRAHSFVRPLAERAAFRTAA